MSGDRAHSMKESRSGDARQRVTLNALGQLTIGPFGSNLVAGDYQGSGVPIVFVRDIKADGFRWQSDVYITRQKAQSLAAHDIVGGDVAVTKMGLPPGIAAVYPANMPPGVITADVIRIRPDRSLVDARWLAYAINAENAQAQVRWITGGVTRPKVTLADFRRLEVTLPPLREQSRVAEAIAAIDDTITQTEAVIGKLATKRTAIAGDVLTGRCVGGPDHVAAKRAMWAFSLVEREFDISAGITLGPERVPRHNPRRYLRVANVQRSRIDLNDLLELEATDAEMASRSLRTDDLLVVEGHANPNEIGRCAIVGRDAEGMTFQNHLFRLRSRRLMPAFAVEWLNSDAVRGYWRRMCGTSSGLNTINRTMLKRVAIPLPPRDEQDRIVAVLDAHDARIRAEEAARDKLVALKRGLLRDLLTGNVRVPVSSGAPAASSAQERPR